VAVRDETLERAGCPCEYVGRNGQRCTERVGLEIDHREVAVLRVETTRQDSLRVLCLRHNAYEARRRELQVSGAW
jgi:hypothetical protein